MIPEDLAAVEVHTRNVDALGRDRWRRSGREVGIEDILVNAKAVKDGNDDEEN